MQQDEAQLIKRVLGRRLSFLSRHAGVRQSILERVLANEDPLVVIQNLSVDGVQIDLLGQNKEAFVKSLDSLMPGEQGAPGAGKQYSDETPDDTEDMRNHLWSEWEPLLKPGGVLLGKLRQAIITLLSYGKAVTVGGKYTGNRPDIVTADSQHPELTFQRPSIEWPDEMKMAGEVPRE